MNPLDKVFNYILRFKRKNDGNSPTLRQICDGCKIPSTSTVDWYLDKLAADGRIELRRVGASRLICVPGGHWETYETKVVVEPSFSEHLLGLAGKKA